MLNTTTSEGPVVIVSFILLAVSFRFDSCDPRTLFFIEAYKMEAGIIESTTTVPIL